MLNKLVIEAFSDESMDMPAGDFQVQINPEKYTHSLATAFSEDKGIDTYSTISRFKTQLPQDVGFEFYLDATGAVDIPNVKGVVDTPRLNSVNDKIEEFRQIAYNYHGDSHSPNYLKLSWGSLGGKLGFKCMLSSLNIEYVLFSPSGMPLRARLAVKFREHLTPKDIANRARKQSTDLTHVRRVIEGISLSTMCHQHYRDSRYCIQVARENDLNDLVSLTPGSEVRFPPLID